MTEHRHYENTFNEAQNHVKEIQEENRQKAALEAQKKKGKGKKKAAEEAAPEEDEEDKKEEENYKLDTRDGFTKALKASCKMPFLFGPIEFSNLNAQGEQASFDFEGERSKVTECLERSALYPGEIFENGFRVKIKNRNLKRRSSLLKHARFLRNLEVTPNLPAVKETSVKDDD